MTVLSDVGLVTRLVNQVIGTKGSWVRHGFKMDVSQTSCRHICPTPPSDHLNPHIRDPQGCVVDGIFQVNLQWPHLAAAERRCRRQGSAGGLGGQTGPGESLPAAHGAARAVWPTRAGPGRPAPCRPVRRQQLTRHRRHGNLQAQHQNLICRRRDVSANGMLMRQAAQGRLANPQFAGPGGRGQPGRASR